MFPVKHQTPEYVFVDKRKLMLDLEVRSSLTASTSVIKSMAFSEAISQIKLSNVCLVCSQE